jgi:hypothetical protein
MTLNPVETLNVFDANLTEQLRERSKSPNLLRTRAPFIRLTTGANMGNLVDALNQMATNNPSVDLGFDNGKLAQEYSDCTFFTLGLHGWDNLNYSATDLYGTKGDKGLVVGVTYKAGQQKLVYTFGGNGQTTDFRQNATVITAQVSTKNHPPPGITSAKVERLRNGNVLRFTVETQCYTQDQLQMLDLLCYVPGMTCVLEWGSVMTTPNGIQRPRNVLDFTNYEEAKSLIINADKISRRDFISRWCAPNNYNYDWVVANIANIKTRLENNIYKTTIIAYGKADNLMYISAYATSNKVRIGIL